MEQIWKNLSLPSESHPTGAPAAIMAAEPPLHGLGRRGQFLAFLHNKATVSKAQSDDERLKTHDYSKNGSFCACSSDKKDSTGNNYEIVVDRKRQRLMNNRESAARSRARKQAYTYELEAEVAHLKKEIAELRREQEKLLVESVGDHGQKKQKLLRTLTAPF